MKIKLKKSESRIMTIIIIALTLVSLALAAVNNPGHDTLYIEQQGDSEINGTLNISGNLSAESITYSGVDLDLRGDGFNTASSNNQIIGGSSWLSIQSLGDIFINTLQGTTSMLYLGDGADTVNLNITGALYVLGGTARVGGQNICLENGTNCPSALGGANISGTGTQNYIAKWTDGDSLGNSIIYDNGTNVGIGAIAPAQKLQVAGNVNVSGYNVSTVNCIIFDSGGKICSGS
jgi:hypothetical protein